MKSVAEIRDLLGKFEKTYKYAVGAAQQGSEAWFKLKLGVISASEASSVVAKTDSLTRLTYMAELVAQICTGLQPELKAAAIDWGQQNEDAARSYYEFASGLTMTQLPFVFKDDSFRIGCSPDGLVTEKKGAEIKCPYDSANFIKFLVADTIKPEWKWQNQFQMWVLDAEEWDCCQFDPRMKKIPLAMKTIARDEKMQKTLEDAVPQFIADMDKMLIQIGVKWGDQWLRLAEEPRFHAEPPA